MISNQLSTDITISNKSNVLITFNATDVCNDRMRVGLCSIVLRQIGHAKGIVSCHSHTITQMEHKILTTHRESITSIVNTIGLKFGGTGQGSAGSGVLWY